MRIGVISSTMPLVNGGARLIAEWLNEKLNEAGHQSEVVYLPSTEEPPFILSQMAAFRMIRLDDYFDRVITLRPPSHAVRHKRKVVWFIHHLRTFYDLWQSSYCAVPDNEDGRALRAAIVSADTAALAEAHTVFANSQIVHQRLQQFNGIRSDVLYPPLLEPDLFVPGEYGEEIVSVCRLEDHKRQHLLIEALARTRTPVKLRLAGTTINVRYLEHLRATARRLGVGDRLIFEPRWISEDEKAERIGRALACAYLPYDEDSYGYPTIEAAHAQRCTITAKDSGGVREFVIDGVNGIVTEPDPSSIAESFDRLYGDRKVAERLGLAAHERIGELKINWSDVIERLLS